MREPEISATKVGFESRNQLNELDLGDPQLVRFYGTRSGHRRSAVGVKVLPTLRLLQSGNSQELPVRLLIPVHPTDHLQALPRHAKRHTLRLLPERQRCIRRKPH